MAGIVRVQHLARALKLRPRLPSQSRAPQTRDKFFVRATTPPKDFLPSPPTASTNSTQQSLFIHGMFARLFVRSISRSQHQHIDRSVANQLQCKRSNSNLINSFLGTRFYTTDDYRTESALFCVHKFKPVNLF